MTTGQRDIDGHPDRTTFCLSGVHNWNLRPRTGDRFVGPAVLDGRGRTRFAFEVGRASNVTLSGLEIRNYVPDRQNGAIQAGPGGTRWTLENLLVHDNGYTGAVLGVGWKVIGGRYFDNRVLGLASIDHDVTVDGAELDHNNFTDDTYRTRNHDCGDEAGGFKWFGTNTTIENVSVHDNACVGLWADGNATDTVISNSRIFDNWSEGIFIEISTRATITGNTVYGNGHKGGGGSNSFGCSHWLYGGGITVAASGSVTVANNNVYGNCNGITATQEKRPDGKPGLLRAVSVHDNVIDGPGGRTGAGSRPDVDLSHRNIVFADNNTFRDRMMFCSVFCS